MTVENKDILKIAEFLRNGFYRVKESGEFIEASPGAREIFGIPGDLEDVFNYSIAKMYAPLDDRTQRIENLKKLTGKPVSDVLSLRVNNENKLLFALCWCDESEGELTVNGFVADIEDRIIFPKMFDALPMGIYELDENNKIVRFNKKALEMFGFGIGDDLNGKNISDLYVDPKDLNKFSEKVSKDGFAQDVFKFKNADRKIIELKCISKQIKGATKARWGFILDVTQRERYFRALDRLPTGYFYIEYYETEEHKHLGRIAECNEQFARILRADNKEDLIGEDIRLFYVNEKEGETYLKAVAEADRHGKPILNYPFRLRRVTKEIIHITVDSHLVRENGKVIGREGTIRNITKEVKLRKEVDEAEKRLKKNTADISHLIHNFLHPVIKFAGNSEMMHQMGDLLNWTVKKENYSDEQGTNFNAKEFGKILMAKLVTLRDALPTVNKDIPYSTGGIELLKVIGFKEILSQIINVFDYSLQEEEVMLDRAVKDTALWVLDELKRIEYYKYSELKMLVPEELIVFLQGILFRDLSRSTEVLIGETEIMKRNVEALRAYIVMKKERVYSFSRHDVGKILEENVRLFKPVLLEENIGIDFKTTGNLNAEISSNDIDRVICNLLHNVKKYAYGGRGKFVKIDAKERQPGDEVVFFIESLGIPITQEEIENGDIFEFGNRGQLVYISDRDGTGVGLADAKEVTEVHSGKIRVESRPSRDDGHPLRYKVPYLTRVTIRLPKKQKVRWIKK